MKRDERLEHSERLEREVMCDVVARLTARFSGTYSSGQVAAVVMKNDERLKDSPVRDYVPVLVEHASLEQLRDAARTRSAGSSPEGDAPDRTSASPAIWSPYRRHAV
ncbi:three-helix bundle dimerization domain-containing protein [Nonomuraea roseoviolacea]|uniref:three-helix bundle dimerization domain-containing protein n=1 Tax=Nonomuraea roseoviolacea TaxID=103837 RepID=UPI0031D7DA0C